MQVPQGQSANSPWDIPGSVQGPPPVTGQAPVTTDQGRPEQTWIPAPEPAPRSNTLSEQIYSGIVNVNEHPENVQQLDQLDAMADQLVDRHQAEVDAGKVGGTPLDPAAQTAAQRTWAREREVLGALAEPGQKANRISETIKSAAGDPVRLAVLAEEAPSYLRAAGIDPSFLDTVFAEVIPGQAERIERRDKANMNRTALKHASQMVRNAAEKGTRSVGLDLIAPAISRNDPDAGMPPADGRPAAVSLEVWSDLSDDAKAVAQKIWPA